MERNAWHYHEYVCPLCGLPFRMAGERGWILDGREVPPPPEFDNEDAIAMLARNELWLEDVTLLCDPDDEIGLLIPSFAYEDLGNPEINPLRGWHPSIWPLPQPLASSNIEEYKAKHMGGPCFYLYEPGGTRREVNVNNLDFPTFDGRSYIPIHSKCLYMAKRTISSSSQKYISSIRGLFLALRWRHAISLSCGLEAQDPVNYTLGQAFWYRPYGSFWEGGVYDEKGNSKAERLGPTQDVEFNLLYTFLGDPIEVEDLTDTLLSNLEPCRRDAAEDEARSFQAHIATLPEDVFQIILSHLRPYYRDLPRKATNMIPQSFWKNELMMADNGLLPWLWDMEPDKVNSKANEPCPEGEDFEWNWELLFRQLSRGVDGGIRPDVPDHIDVYKSSYTPKEFDEHLWTYTGYDDDLRNVPRGLHNRRRIWQLLEEIFVGDQFPTVDIPNEFMLSVQRSLGDDFSVVDEPREVELPPNRMFCMLPWNKDGSRRDGDDVMRLPLIVDSRAFVRRIGGEVYVIDRTPGQYQRISQFRELNDEEWETLSCEPASVAEILEVIRKRGYPISVQDPRPGDETPLHM
ncbi:hypothetical protein F4804DRAFT_311601 [Jackrogersella minutella]|nr:hypothetical protein F4804DRAFT_311601 [Jackrogersella minutella]